MEEFKNEKWTLEDGRRAERRVTDTTTSAGEGERVIELHMEDERPLKLQQRVVEKRKPIVYEREIQTVDGAGNIIQKKVESIEPRTQMQMVEHIGSVNALAVENDCDCHVTREEMLETIVTALKTFKEESPVPVTTGLANEISNRIGLNSTDSSKLWIGVVAVLVIVLGYVVFGM